MQTAWLNSDEDCSCLGERFTLRWWCYFTRFHESVSGFCLISNTMSLIGKDQINQGWKLTFLNALLPCWSLPRWFGATVPGLIMERSLTFTGKGIKAAAAGETSTRCYRCDCHRWSQNTFLKLSTHAWSRRTEQLQKRKNNLHPSRKECVKKTSLQIKTQVLFSTVRQTFIVFFFKLGSKLTQLRLYGWEIWKAEKNTKTFPKDGRLDRRDT